MALTVTVKMKIEGRREERVTVSLRPGRSQIAIWKRESSRRGLCLRRNRDGD